MMQTTKQTHGPWNGSYMSAWKKRLTQWWIIILSVSSSTLSLPVTAASKITVNDSTVHHTTDDVEIHRQSYDVPDNNATVFVDYDNTKGSIGFVNMIAVAGPRRHVTHVLAEQSRVTEIRHLTIENAKSPTDITELGPYLFVDRLQVDTGTVVARNGSWIELLVGNMSKEVENNVQLINHGIINRIYERAGQIDVTNAADGIITGSIHANSLVNRGTTIDDGTDKWEVGRVINLKSGKMNVDTLKTHSLDNYGIITTTGDGVRLTANDDNDDAHTSFSNYGQVFVIKNTGISNDGTTSQRINNYGDITDEGHINDALLIHTDVSTVVNNYGNLIGSYAFLSENGDTTLNNIGYMRGLAGRAVDESVTGTLTINNGNQGVWESDFGTMFEDPNLQQYIDILHNDGTIRSLKGKQDEKNTLAAGRVENNGTIDVTASSLVIDGDYIGGENARLETSGRLGGDDTVVPTLTITGTASGKTTKVKVDNLGGEGGTTVEGITVVAAKSTTGEGFTKDGRIVAGTYDYDLVRYETPEMTEWRLISTAVPGPTPGPTPEPVRKYRPEAAAYGENMRQANTLFLTGSDQRQAVGEYTDPMTGRTETSSLWLSQTGGHSTHHDASGQLKSDYNRYVVQLGGTVLSLSAGKDGHLDAGFQAGYGHASGDNRSGMTGYRARGTVSGYSTGIYGTWRQHREGQPGAYVSTTLQYSWLKNQVKGDDLAAEKYDARGTTLSLEGGYDLAVWQGGEQNSDSLFIRPRAQVTRMGVKADEHREANGTRVSQQGDGNMFSRTGVRVWLDKAVTKTQRVQPFVEANWLHNTRDFCSSMDGVRDCQVGNRDQAEVLAGVTGDVSRNVAVTAQAGGQFGSQASRDLAGTLNVSVKF
ncbi:autotransporter outer membrane beta-barrel domain-containing protein [Salmonella enterica]|nr:autotransporter outer membrane beta-barrel domain-containing protein [Salmonella enterica subsp. diarizonae]EIB6552388.1 autotransporter outer membrane beta-barrel domain-containing protein [Salmonella enterica]HAU2692291.1 autotransporter outer membrane beta-barrel domain-containing protein [Salmonella enterica subsp. diarizonae]